MQLPHECLMRVQLAHEYLMRVRLSHEYLMRVQLAHEYLMRVRVSHESLMRVARGYPSPHENRSVFMRNQDSYETLMRKSCGRMKILHRAGPPLEPPNFGAGPASTACLVRRAFERLTVIAVWSMLPAHSAPLAFGSPSLPLPSSNARHPASAPARCARPVAPAAASAHCAHPRPPFGASKLHSLKRLQSHELKPVDEYCTTPFCNGAFRGEICHICAPL